MPPTESNGVNTTTGRDSKGRFTKGNGGGPGNPFARKVAQLRSALIERVTEQDIKDIAEVLILQARTGDHAAIKLLFQYVLGKPAEAVDPDTVEIEEFQKIYAPQKEIMQQFPETMHTVPPGLVCGLTRVINEVCVGQLQKLLELPHEQLAEAAGRLGEMLAGAGGKVKRGVEVEEDPFAEDVADEEAVEDDRTDEATGEVEEDREQAGANGPRQVAALPSTNGDDGERVGGVQAQASRPHHESGRHETGVAVTQREGGRTGPGKARPTGNGRNGSTTGLRRAG